MKTRSPWALVLLAMLSGAAAPLSTASVARGDDTARARTLFQDGLQLEAANNFAGALAKFQEVAQVKRTPQVVFHIALCQEKLGHWVEALGGYRIAAHDAGASDDPKLAKVVETATEALTALEKRIPTLVITRGKGAELAKVSIDGVDIGGAMFGKPQQIDPGAHSVEATQPGKTKFKEIVQVAEGESKTIEIKFSSKEPAGADATGDKPDKPEKGDKGGEGGEKGGAGLSTADAKSIPTPYLVMGAGGVSLLASGVFYLLRNSAISDLDAQCKGNICPTSAKSIEDTGKSMTLLGNVTLGLGVVGIGVGSVLLLTQKSPESPARPAATGARILDVAIRPVSNGMGASLVGQF